MLAVFLPQFALHLFEAIVPEQSRRSMLLRVASILVVPMLVLALGFILYGLLAPRFVTAPAPGVVPSSAS